MRSIRFTFTFIGLLFFLVSKGQSVSFYSDINSGCRPLAVNFTNNSSIDSSGVTFVWNFSDGENYVGFHASHTFLHGGNYHVSLCAYDSYGMHMGCYDSFIQVEGNSGQIYLSHGKNICPGQNFSVYSYNNWNWFHWVINGDTIYNYQFNYTLDEPGTYEIQLIGEDICGVDTLVTDVFVSNSAIPENQIFSHGHNAHCPGDDIMFYSQFDALSTIWNFGDGSFSALSNPSHSFNSIGNYMVVMNATNMCGNSNSDTLYVDIQNDVEAYAYFDAWPPNACPMQEINFNTSSTGDYVWNFGDGSFSTEMNPKHSYAEIGTYQVVLQVTNSCGNSAMTSQNIEIQTNPGSYVDGYIYFENFDNWDDNGEVTTITVCPETEVIFNSYAWGDSQVSYFWNFGDGNTSSEQRPSHIFSNTGINTVMLIVSTSCGGADTLFRWVNVDPNLAPNTQMQVLPQIICPGELVYFFDNDFEYNNGYIYNINFGDGTFENGITENSDMLEVLASHVYSEQGTYNYTIAITNACGNSEIITGTISVDQTGNFTPFYYVSNSTMGDDGGGNNFGNDWSNPSGDDDFVLTVPFTFPQWEAGMNNDFYFVYWFGGLVEVFGNGEPGDPDGLVYHEGEGDVTAYIPNQADSITVAAIWFCNGIENSNDGPDAYGILGAFAIQPGQSLTVSAPGVTIENWDGNCDPVISEPNPHAGCPGDNVVFIAVGGLEYEWHIGDSIYYGPYVMHNFPDTGIFDTYVVITNGCGQEDIVHSLVEISTHNVPEVWFYTNGNTCAGSPVQFYPEDYDDLGNNTYYWDFGDGSWSTEMAPWHTYNEPGDYQATLIVTNGCGSNSMTQNIWVSGAGIVENVIHGCVGENNGQISLEIQNGWWPITFMWSNGASGQAISNLNAGTYACTVTDNSGCSIVKNFEINPTNPELSFLVSDISCNGNSDGSATVILNNYQEPALYFWSTGSNGTTINGLSEGTYDITIVDANGCVKSDAVSISEPEILTSNLNFENLSCYQSNNGSIDLSPIGGTAPYSYFWSCIYFTADTEDLTDLPAGVFAVTLTDSRGCTTTNSATLTQPTQLNVGYAITNAACGASNGSVNLTVTGSVPPYSFIWTNGATTEDLINYPANFYGVTVTDASGCFFQSYYSIVNPGAPVISSYDVSNVTCFGDQNGGVDLYVTGGLSPYSYSWSNGSNASSIQNLSGGTYSVTVTAADNCVVVNPSLSVYEPDLFFLEAEVYDVSCYGANDGIIIIYQSGGNGGGSYVWSNGGNSYMAENLSVGTYSVTVSDSYGCVATSSDIEIVQPDLLSASSALSNVTCNGGNNGSIDLSPSGGTTPYTFIWSNGATTEDVQNLIAGTYSVTITDLNGCGLDITTTITEPTAIYAIEQASSISCFGGNDGTAEVTPYGGVAPYSILWETNVVTNEIIGLYAGYYSYIITDNNNCIYQDSIFVDSPSQIQFSLTHTDVSCYGNNDGSALLHNISGGTPNSGTYGYQWSNNGAFPMIENLVPGTYYITVFDANNCQVYGSVEIEEPEELYVGVLALTDAPCHGDLGGSIMTMTMGGTSPFVFSWSNGETNGGSLSDLYAGSYSATIYDANNCFAYLNDVNIAEPDPISVSYVSNPSLCFDCSDGSIDITVAGGNGGYSYDWSNGATSEDVTGLVAGYYDVEITDMNNCFYNETIFVDFIDLVKNPNNYNDFMVFPNPNYGEFVIVSESALNYEILNVLGEQIELIEHPTKISKIHLNVPSGIYLIKANIEGEIRTIRVFIR
jgi:PKD repeat protein